MKDYYIKPEAWSKVYETLKRIKNISIKKERKTNFFKGYLLRNVHRSLMEGGKNFLQIRGNGKALINAMSPGAAKIFWNNPSSTSPKIVRVKIVRFNDRPVPFLCRGL